MGQGAPGASHGLDDAWSTFFRDGGSVFALPPPAGEPVRFALMRWDPVGSHRPDGLADVLGLRRMAGGLVDVVWWSVRADGGFGRPKQADVAGGLDIEHAVELGVLAVVTQRIPKDVSWVETP